MVGPKVNLKVRGELLRASEQAASVGDFHRRVVEVLKTRKVRVTITQKYKKGTIKNQFIFQPGGKTSVLQYRNGKLIMVHMLQKSLSDMNMDPTGIRPTDKRRKTVYDLLSSAMRTAKGEKVDGVSIDL